MFIGIGLGLVVGILLLVGAARSYGPTSVVLAVLGVIFILSSIAYRPFFHPMFFGGYYGRPVYVHPVPVPVRPVYPPPGYRYRHY